jgi:predicted regulator of Ras-like GTPase activity (Roadblock/LC7/MglB family)
MDWFERLSNNRYIEAVLLANNQGRLLRSSREISSEDELLPSMLQAFEVLAQTLTAEFGCGEARMVHIMTEQGHLMMFPLFNSSYYVLAMVERTAPVMLVTVELERTLSRVSVDDLPVVEDDIGGQPDLAELDATELIEAVREWLRQRPADI